MTARVEEVKAFKSIDDEVYTTFVKAHHRNIFVLCHKIFGVWGGDYLDDSDSTKYHSAAKLLHAVLTGSHSHSRAAALHIKELAKELE